MSNQPVPLNDDQALEERVESIMGDDTMPISPPVKPTQQQVPVEKTKPRPVVDSSDALLSQIGATTDTGPNVDINDRSISNNKHTKKVESVSTPTPIMNVPDSSSNESIDTIIASEENAITPAPEESPNRSFEPVVMKERRMSKILHAFGHGKIWFVCLLLVILSIGAIPYSRYRVLGLVVKETVSVHIVDSTLHTPVSNAMVSLGGIASKTNMSGNAIMKVPLGHYQLTVTKLYFKSDSESVFVGLKHQYVAIQLAATGRPVPISVENSFTGKPLANAEVSILNTTAKTNQSGMANIVLPSSTKTATATVTLNGYIQKQAVIEITGITTAVNTIKITPAGAIFFLSNQSGTIDVVKTNLDGTDRQTILAGTGNEDSNTTSLLASQDWRFLILKAQRAGTQPSLYLIDTSTNKLTEFDDSASSYTLVGWYGHTFVYSEIFSSVPKWQSGYEELRSYNADTGQSSLLDQNQSIGIATGYGYQGFYDVNIIGGLLVYDTQWSTFTSTGTAYNLGNVTDTIRSVHLNGDNKKDYISALATKVSSIQAVHNAPETVNFAFFSSSTGAPTYYEYQNQSVSTPTNLTPASFTQTYPSYLVSPSNNQTFWSVPENGKNGLYIGDDNGQNQKQEAQQSDYLPYGWYGDSYLILSKNNNQLAILPVGTALQPLPITTYYQTPQLYTGAQYSYGGL